VSYVSSGLHGKLLLESHLAETGQQATQAVVDSPDVQWEDADDRGDGEDDHVDEALTVGGALLTGAVIVGGAYLLRRATR